MLPDRRLYAQHLRDSFERILRSSCTTFPVTGLAGATIRVAPTTRAHGLPIKLFAEHHAATRAETYPHGSIMGW